RVFGRDRVPTTGGCLILCNHASLIDRLILRAACPRRLTIVPDGAEESTADAIADALDRGEAVLLFPEGVVTRSGHILAFGTGVEAILAKVKSDVVVIPTCTDGLWGGVFSYHGGSVL